LRKGSFLSGFLLGFLAIGILLSASSCLVANSWAWSNGGYSSDPADPDYGTHDWIAEHALDWLPAEEKQYIRDNLAAYLYGTELPDNGGAPDGIGDTTKHHVYYNSAEVMTDDMAAVRASTEYNDTLTYLKANDYANASKNAGIMTHYIADMAVFGHVMGAATDWGAEAHHSDYEDYVNASTSTYAVEFNSFLSFDGSLDAISAYEAAKKLAYDTTFDLDGDLTCVWMDQNYDWNDATFMNRAGESLNLAVNYLTDALHTLYLEATMPDEYYLQVPHYAQTAGYYCGPAALEMVFDYYGPNIPQAEIADVARTAPDGTYTPDMVRAAHFSNLSTSVGNEMPGSIQGYTARKLGYAALEHSGMTIDQLKFTIALGYPIIVLTTWHFRVAVGYSETHITFQDSWYGRMYNMTYSSFDSDWDYSGHWALLVTPWKVRLTAPSETSVGSPFNVTATITYISPPPFSSSQYPASLSNATLILPSWMSLAAGQTVKKTISNGNIVAGETVSLNWTVLATARGNHTMGVETQGKVAGWVPPLPSYPTPYSYIDRIGGYSQTSINAMWDETTPPATTHNYDGLWHTTDFRITLTATDTISGVADTYYKLNDGPTRTVLVDDHPFITVGAANNKLEYWSIDNAGNEESHHILTEIKLDKTIPVGSILINDGDTYTTSKTITLTLSAADTLSGAYQVRYSNESIWTTEPWETPSPTKTLTLPPSDEAKTIYYQIRDNAGLISTTYSDTIIMDTTSPTGSFEINEGADYTTTNTVALSMTSADTTSGVAQVRFSNDGSTWTPWETYSTTKTWAVTTNDGIKTVYYQIEDNAGLISTAYSDTIILDVTAPAGSVAINEGTAYTATTAVTLTLPSEDEASGVAEMRFSHDETTWTPWEAYSTTKTWVLTANDGTKTVYCQIKDNAGLISSTYSDTIVLDTALPAVSITGPAPSYETKSSTLTVTWTGADEISGISHYEIRLDDKPWNDVGTDTAFTLTDLAEGTHTIEVKATDKAGNQKQDTVAFVVNTSPLLGPGYMEEAAVAAALIIVVLAVIAYVLRKRGKR
jgi:hypothetical protein